MQYIAGIILLIVVQVFILNNVHIFGVATPLLYVYLVVLFRRGTSHVQRLLTSFSVGLVIDIFCNTPGLTSASLTLTGFIQPYILELFLRKEDEQNLLPSVSRMGFFSFLLYTFIILLIHGLTIFCLELFSFDYWLECLTGCLGSLLLTIFIIITIDSTRK